MAKPARNAGFNGMMLRQARRYNRMTQTELAAEVGVHRTTLVRWESGMSEPSPEQIEQLAVATSTPADWFMGEAAEAISFDDPCWLMDRFLATFPLHELQARTAAALKSLRRNINEIARLSFLPKDRILELLEGKKPNAREIQRLRDTFGQDFNPTPTLARRLDPVTPGRTALPTSVAAGSPSAPASSSPSATMTPEEKQDLVLQRLLRLEQRLERMEQVLEGLQATQSATLVYLDTIAADSKAGAAAK